MRMLLFFRSCNLWQHLHRSEALLCLMAGHQCDAMRQDADSRQTQARFCKLTWADIIWLGLKLQIDMSSGRDTMFALVTNRNIMPVPTLPPPAPSPGKEEWHRSCWPWIRYQSCMSLQHTWRHTHTHWSLSVTFCTLALWPLRCGALCCQIRGWKKDKDRESAPWCIWTEKPGMEKWKEQSCPSVVHQSTHLHMS